MVHPSLYPSRRLGRLAGLSLALLGLGLPTSARPLPAPSAPAGSPGLASTPALPATKPVTVVVEGEPQTVVMQLYRGAEVPLVTYYPATMAVEEACDADGCGVSFTNEATDTGVIFLFPAGATQATEAGPAIFGPAGLIGGSGWEVGDSYTDADSLEFPWARQMTLVRTPDLSAVGVVYLGEAQGRGFAALAIFPTDAGDGFMPRANALFEAVQVQP